MTLACGGGVGVLGVVRGVLGLVVCVCVGWVFLGVGSAVGFAEFVGVESKFTCHLYMSIR